MDLTQILIAATAIVGGIQIVITHTAPHTKTDLDDKAAKWLKVAHDVFQKAAGNYGNAKNEKTVK